MGKGLVCIVAYITLLMASCREPISEAKFGIFPLLDRGEFLSKHVHAESWQIVYGFFGEPEKCKSPVLADRETLSDEKKKERDEIVSQMEGSVADALDAWLSPIRDLVPHKRVIAKEDFEFIELTPLNLEIPDSGGYRAIYTADYLKANNLGDTVDLMIAFGCNHSRTWDGGRGVALINTVYDYFFPNRVPPDVTMWEARIPYGDRRRVHLSLAHELGHAFGLHDTYRYKDISPGLGQSMSVMNILNGVGARQYASAPINPFSIYSDDVKGLTWLYYYYHAPERLEGEKCLFRNYEVDNEGEEGLFCVPKYPVIHEIHQARIREQHGDTAGAQRFMASARVILRRIAQPPKYTKQDEHGRTALHYAVIYEGRSSEMQRDWRRTIRILLEPSYIRVDREIADNTGKTACDYLQCRDTENTATFSCNEVRRLLCN